MGTTSTTAWVIPSNGAMRDNRRIKATPDAISFERKPRLAVSPYAVLRELRDAARMKFLRRIAIGWETEPLGGKSRGSVLCSEYGLSTRMSRTPCVRAVDLG